MYSSRVQFFLGLFMKGKKKNNLLGSTKADFVRLLICCVSVMKTLQSPKVYNFQEGKIKRNS